MDERVHKARLDMESARRRYAASIKEAYPIGAEVDYCKHGASPKVGVVVRHGYDGRLLIEPKHAPSRQMWITGAHLL